jgi:hypothetical protein
MPPFHAQHMVRPTVGCWALSLFYLFPISFFKCLHLNHLSFLSSFLFLCVRLFYDYSHLFFTFLFRSLRLPSLRMQKKSFHVRRTEEAKCQLVTKFQRC